MVGPLKKAPSGHTDLPVLVDKFTKWIKVKPIMNICSQEAVEFFLDIVYRFGVPNCIIMDNGTNFTDKKFLDFCDRYGIRVDWASVGHPRTNGQVEQANGMVLMGLKPWFTPFFLTYRSEAVLPSDLNYGAPRGRAFDPDRAMEAQQDAIDLLEEARQMTLICSARYQQTLCRHQVERKMRKLRERKVLPPKFLGSSSSNQDNQDNKGGETQREYEYRALVSWANWLSLTPSEPAPTPSS
ncbi:uncharacterized protein LOC101779999 [Setaria italica]|uniref:uncharacterized protein LOC101779999 n=1 Tax=Setaria italica TaxID=4555 RepID=UPI000350EC8B|nr:uncharacterized protein LOC101779999 [Setaria italica]